MTPAINEFRRMDGSTDLTLWRYDIIARLLVDMEEGGSGFSTTDLCQIYFGSVDLEKKIWMGDQMQGVREMLQLRPTPLILRNSHYRWYIVHPHDAGGLEALFKKGLSALFEHTTGCAPIPTSVRELMLFQRTIPCYKQLRALATMFTNLRML